MTHEDIGRMIKPIVEKYPVQKVILFGSYARGENNEASDIDLIVDSGNSLNGFETFGLFGRILELFSCPVDIFDLREVNVGTGFYENILKEGIIIYGDK